MNFKKLIPIIGIIALCSCQTVQSSPPAPILPYDEFIKELKLRKAASLAVWQSCIDNQILMHKNDANKSWQTASVIAASCFNSNTEYLKYLLQQENNWPARDALKTLRQNPSMSYLEVNTLNRRFAESELKDAKERLEEKIRVGLSLDYRCTTTNYWNGYYTKKSRTCSPSDFNMGDDFTNFYTLTYSDIEYRFLSGNQLIKK
ncbi:MAG: hypothetical protein J0L55_15050 [Caulobacterales bacterium]|nr:hypothetical protein [Caulobacterales bacterium]